MSESLQMIWAGSVAAKSRAERVVEDCLTIDLAWIMRLAPIRIGQLGSGEIHWSSQGEPLGRFSFCLDLTSRNTARLTLHDGVTAKHSNWSLPDQSINLTATAQNFGGLRWWMHCPVSGDRARTLHLSQGGSHFASRQALGLIYRSERLSRFDRPFEKLFRAQRHLSFSVGLGVSLARPKGMWRRTFLRHVAQIDGYDVKCVTSVGSLIAKA
jgi:hypothetical protein